VSFRTPIEALGPIAAHQRQNGSHAALRVPWRSLRAQRVPSAGFNLSGWFSGLVSGRICPWAILLRVLAMPIRQFTRGASFDPEVITAMSTAFDDALKTFGVTDRTGPDR
jgi:hypothetical protein